MLRASEDLKPSVQPTISTEAAKRGIGMDRTKTVIGAGSQKVTAQPDVKFATSKQSRTLMAGQNWVPPTNRGNQGNAFQIQQFTNTQKQYSPSQGPNFVSNAKDDSFITS